MGKKLFWLAGGLVIVCLLIFYSTRSGSEPETGGEAPAIPRFFAPETDFPVNSDLKAALVFGELGSPALAAYQEVLAEEGFPFEVVPQESLPSYSPGDLKKRYVALIFPEEVNQKLSPALASLVESYVLLAGGKVFLGGDAGTLEEGGSARTKGLFSALAGLEYRLGRRREGVLAVPAGSPLRKFFDPGLYDGNVLKVFDCPPVKDAHLVLAGVSGKILAYSGSEAPENGYLVQRSYPGGGVVLYVNGAPGLLKARQNVDFVLRGLLKYFLLEVVGMPRLVAAPNGVAGLVVGVHLCSGAYFRDLDRIFALKLFTQEFPFSFYVTAGPDNDRPGDKRGFDVLNPRKGGRYLELLQQYGSIGSHGGWIHNYWAYHFRELSDDEKKWYINYNFQALQEALGQPVLDYAAPGGAHDAEVNEFLAAWGIKAASLPLAFNSPPTRGWFDGRPERRFWLFGYTGTIYGTAFENMLASGRKPAQIQNDICRLLDALVQMREIRLIYFHPVSVARHPEMWRGIQNYILKYVSEGALSVRTMADFADFLDRHAKVRFAVRWTGQGYHITASSPDSLKEMTFALPARNARIKSVPGYKVKERDGWAYVTVTRDVKLASFSIPVVKNGGR